LTLRENDPAPDFTLPDETGEPVRLSDLRGQRVILYFYPRADTPGCTLESCEFRDLHPRIEEKGAVVLGVSPDSVKEVRRFREKYGFPFHLLADADHQVAEAYGAWVEKSMFGNDYWGVERSTFVIDEHGRIERAYRKVKAEGHAAEVVEGLG
jgi:peroxiredoxin Q/BCP